MIIKKTFLFLALISLSSPAFVAEAKVESAPGIQKKIPLAIFDVQIQLSSNAAIISWSTNKPSRGSVLISEIPVGLDAVGYGDEKFGTSHDVTVGGLYAGQGYEYRIEVRDEYGYSATATGTFTGA
jgi:hypothetical protein